MKISVIIVNYNVKHFLEQCLWSLKDALAELESEVLVVDNNSSDGSVEYLVNTFPGVKFIVNTENVGFAKANNQAVLIAKGEYILFLNPDTLLPANAIKQTLLFMDQQRSAGALGIRMMDGSGRFLRESKRAFPSPFTSLFKLLGFSSLFPESEMFARYHLGHLPEWSNHEVDVLAGAFMMVRNEVLKTVGCFDEKFFMYGEDIDLSYRIQNAGWKNYYYSGISIIHFKGESTKKGSLNYVRMFYQAMSLFVEKHYSSGKAGFFRFFIMIAIWLRAIISAFARFIKWGRPSCDRYNPYNCQYRGDGLVLAAYHKTRHPLPAGSFTYCIALVYNHIYPGWWNSWFV
jgi:GT2 family glycosyltransferase